MKYTQYLEQAYGVSEFLNRIKGEINVGIASYGGIQSLLVVEEAIDYEISKLDKKMAVFKETGDKAPL